MPSSAKSSAKKPPYQYPKLRDMRNYRAPRGVDWSIWQVPAVLAAMLLAYLIAGFTPQ